MHVQSPYELKPRQLRALVLLLALLPLVPVTFVVRFVAEDIDNQRLEARERARPVYQKFLDATTEALIANAAKQLPPAPAFDPEDPWRALIDNPTLADTVLIVSPEGRLSIPPGSVKGRTLAAVAGLAQTVIDNGVEYAIPPPSGAVRWRFFCEAPDPLFALHPVPAVTPKERGPTLLFVKSRQHLLETVGSFFQRELNPQSALLLKDENGDSISLVGPADSASQTGGEPLAESTLQPPLPPWRVQLFSVDTALVDGVARSQVTMYYWSVGGMIVVTVFIAAAAGWALTRRLALHELSNDVLATVSHEMKTPLASIRMFIETLRDRRYRGGPEQADEYLALIADENARLTQLVEGFQTLSRMDNPHGHRRGLQPAELDAAEVIAAARSRIGPRLDALNGAFRVEIAQPPPTPFHADRDALVAVLVNLLDNALKYSGDDPHITVRASGKPGEVVFEVSDRGIGIDPSEQGRIFERFYQSDRRLSRSHEGCGLGLNIVRTLVRAHKGSVNVQSTPGEGSTFTVRLPVNGK